MSNPFNSEYVSASLTDIKAEAITSTTSTQNFQEPNAITPLASDMVARKFGFEPERYGLGRPKRIVIRGQISRE